MFNFISLLVLSGFALATSKIQQPRQQVELSCLVRAKFNGVNAERLNFKKSGASHTSDLVFWHLDIVDVSNKEVCPTERELKLRVRGGSYASGPKENPSVTYVVEIKQPERGELISAKIRLLEGQDSFTERNYKEWTLAGIVSE